MEDSRIAYIFAPPGGALAANVVLKFRLPYGFMPTHVSAVGSNANDATIKIGTATSDAACMAAKAFGDSGTPAEYDSDDFADADYQFAKGDILTVTIDFDGAGGTAVQDACVVISGLTGA